MTLEATAFLARPHPTPDDRLQYCRNARNQSTAYDGEEDLRRSGLTTSTDWTELSLCEAVWPSQDRASCSKTVSGPNGWSSVTYYASHPGT